MTLPPDPALEAWVDNFFLRTRPTPVPVPQEPAR